MSNSLYSTYCATSSMAHERPTPSLCLSPFLPHSTLRLGDYSLVRLAHLDHDKVVALLQRLDDGGKQRALCSVIRGRAGVSAKGGAGGGGDGFEIRKNKYQRKGVLDSCFLKQEQQKPLAVRLKQVTTLLLPPNVLVCQVRVCCHIRPSTHPRRRAALRLDGTQLGRKLCCKGLY